MQSENFMQLSEPSDEHILVTATAKSFIWDGNMDEDGSGFTQTQGCISTCAYELMGLPDFSSDRFFDLCKLNEEERRKQILLRQLNFITSLYLPTFLNSVSISLRMISGDYNAGVSRVRIYLILKSFGENRENALKTLNSFIQTFETNFPSEYYSIQRVTDLKKVGALFKPTFTLSAEIIKKEEILDPKFAICPAEYYYAPMNFVPSLDPFVGLVNGLATQKHPVLIDCTLMSTAITDSEKHLLHFLTEQLDEWGAGKEIKHILKSGSTRLKPDLKAKRIGEKYRELIEKYTQLPLFLYLVRTSSDDRDCLTAVTQQIVSSALSAANCNYKIIYYKNEKDTCDLFSDDSQNIYLLENLQTSNIWRLENPPLSIMRLHRFCDVREASAFFRLPVPSRDGCLGVALDEGRRKRDPSGHRQPIILGNFIEKEKPTEQSAINLQDFAKHAFIAGVPGSGKTTICFNILTQLWDKCQIPFMVFEPAKTEYRALKKLATFKDSLMIFTVGNEFISPFRVNPFEAVPGEDIESHISAINHVISPFKVVLPMSL